jgi:two-component system sensor kinase FixL
MDLGGSATDEFLETIDAPIVILSYEGEIVRFNRACERLTGFGVAEALGRKVWDFLIPDDEIDGAREVFERTRGSRMPTYHTNSWKTKSGGLRLIEWSNRMLRNTRGELVYVLATGIDITEARARERALDDSRAFLRSIVDASPVAIVTINEQGTILSLSRKAEEIFGHSESEALGKNIHILMPQMLRAAHDACLRRYIDTGERKNAGERTKATGLRRNGEEFPAILHVSEFSDGRRIFVGFVEDVSEIAETERRLADTKLQLQHAGRVGAMGEMATSIAHELNQPLTAAASLAGAVALTLIRTECKERHKDAIDQLNDAVSEILRASEIIRQMRDFVRKRRSEKSLHDVNKVVEEASAIALIGTESFGISVRTDYGNNVGQAVIDRIQIQQVVTNLIRNAIDAMRESSERRLTITTEKIDGMIEVRVEDTGIGIPESIRKKLFEPFVTTKPDGTGIGLTISKSIIDSHQGEILTESKNGPGSIFVMRVPAGGDGERDRSK